MKQRLFISLAALLAFFVSNANANTISVDDVTLNAGASKVIKLLLPQTSEEIAGFQFDVEFPNELTMLKSDDGGVFSFDSSAFGDMEINVKLQSDGSYRVMAFSPSLSSISLKGTEVVECKVKADKKVKATTVSLKVKNVVLSDAYGNVTKLSDVISNVTIAPPVKVIAIDKSCLYGESCEGLDYEMMSCYTTGSPTISCAATASSSVGTYEIIVQKGSLDTDTVTLINGTLTITKAPLTIIAKSYTRKQGEENPTLEATYEGFKNGETEAILIQKPTLTTTATSSSTPGTYDIIVSGAEAENYEISYLSGTLTIEANSFTLTYLLDGEVYKTVSYDYGTIITPEPAPSKEGYTFSGRSGIQDRQL